MPININVQAPPPQGYQQAGYPPSYAPPGYPYAPYYPPPQQPYGAATSPLCVSRPHGSMLCKGCMLHASSTGLLALPLRVLGRHHQRDLPIPAAQQGTNPRRKSSTSRHLIATTTTIPISALACSGQARACSAGCCLRMRWSPGGAMAGVSLPGAQLLTNAIMAHARVQHAWHSWARVTASQLPGMLRVMETSKLHMPGCTCLDAHA